MQNSCLKLCLAVLLLAGCSPGKKAAQRPGDAAPFTLRFLDEYVLPHRPLVRGTQAGGFSSIDYDEAKGIYYLICDDRSEISPARYYTMAIDIVKDRIDTVRLLGFTTLQMPGGGNYPPRSTDPEAMRYNKITGELVWASEGERSKAAALNPTIRVMHPDGTYKDSFPLPLRMHVSPGKGPRQNGVFEGLSFADGNKSVYVSIEEPLYEDGPRAAGGDTAAWVRFLKFDVQTKKQVAEYAYRVEPVPYPATPPDAYKINGISDILFLDAGRLIVIERAFSTGRNACAVRLWLADAGQATDISSFPSLQGDLSFTPMRKKLLLDLDSLGRHIDNIEGITFGPLLPNGNRTLILVADDNFSQIQKNQILLFEILP